MADDAHQQPAVPIIERDGIPEGADLEALTAGRIELTPYEFRRPWMRAFVAVLARTGEISSAARAAGINSKWVHVVRNDDPVFAEAWQEALDVSIDLLEQIAIRRATVGEEKVVTRTTRKFIVPESALGADGEAVVPAGSRMVEETVVEERVMVRSDALLMFMLKARRPDTYRERPDPLHGVDRGPTVVQVYRFPDTERARALALLAAERGELPAGPPLPDVEHTNGDGPAGNGDQPEP